MITPNGSQGNLQTITQWRYCSGTCRRSTLMRKVSGDTVWQCPYCGYHEPDPTVQTSAQNSAPKTASTEEPGV